MWPPKPTELAKRLWKARGLWLRILFCWMLGTCFVFFDEVKDYDFRFRLRGNQDSAKQIVLVYFDQEDWTSWHGQSGNLIRSLKEFSTMTDSFFWRAKTWDLLLGKVLDQNPKAVGVTFVFSDQLPRPDESYHSLYDPRVIWAGHLDNEGRPTLPLMASAYGNNVALVDMREDEDRVMRRFTPPLAPLPHMAVKLAEAQGGISMQDLNSLMGETRLINFRGNKTAFTSVSALAVLQDRVPPSFFRDKIVLIGSHSVQAHLYQTPLGTMSRTDVIAQIVDNVIGKRWISRLNFWLCSLYQLAILLAAVFILLTYPQAVSSVFLMWLGLGVTALSIWIFDSYYFWIPAISPLLLALVTYVIFLGYQLSVKENQTWRLEQEKALLSELDQLRNNFVSLISHDLKTPIAKIQAICDRLLAGVVVPDVKDGLTSLRKESVELHRYIQSILQISKLESNQMRVRREASDLNEMVENVVGQLKPLIADKRQSIEMKLEPMFSIEMDGLMIHEVILNLVENAVKYTPNDGKIVVETNEVEDKAIFSVADNGPGIAKDDQDHIFEKFYRGKAHLTPIKGTGLGLFLVKYFIELHGGEVFLESEVNKGTRVGFALPLQS